MKPYVFLFSLVVAMLASQTLLGDIVSTSFNGLAGAQLELFNPVSDASTLGADTLSANVTGTGNGATSNSTTQSDLTYSWDSLTTTLTGTGLVTASKSANSKRGGNHHGDADLSFTFGLDSLTNFSVAGNYGYFGLTGTDDVVSWSLTKSDASFSAGGTANQTSSSVSGQTFADSGQLTAGTYTFAIAADFSETVGQQESRQAGWSLTEFSLTPVAVPESSTWVTLVLGGLAIAIRRQRV